MKRVFIVGAQRSGSTYLYRLLDDHPEICMAKPLKPEPKFFLKEDLFNLGLAHYDASYFQDQTPSTKILGEKSTSYIESIDSAKRIYELFPEGRILIILRNPIERAYSNYRFSLSHGIEHLSFLEALQQEPHRLRSSNFKTSVNPYAYCKRGYYIDYINEYLNIFNSENVKIIIFEELVNNLEALQEIYAWLGICRSHAPQRINEVINAVAIPKLNESEAFSLLATNYIDSIQSLERHLGRPIKNWRAFISKVQGKSQ